MAVPYSKPMIFMKRKARVKVSRRVIIISTFGGRVTVFNMGINFKNLYPYH